MAKHFKSDLLNNLEKLEGPSWVTYYTAKLLIACDFSDSKTKILAQLLWLNDLSARKDGYFYKSHRELMEETNMSRMSVIRAIGWFKEQGFLEVKIKKANGHPTSHYKIDQGAIWCFCRAKILEYNKKK